MGLEAPLPQQTPSLLSPSASHGTAEHLALLGFFSSLSNCCCCFQMERLDTRLDARGGYLHCPS